MKIIANSNLNSFVTFRWQTIIISSKALKRSKEIELKLTPNSECKKKAALRHFQLNNLMWKSVSICNN